jgi:integrase
VDRVYSDKGLDPSDNSSPSTGLVGPVPSCVLPVVPSGPTLSVWLSEALTLMSVKPKTLAGYQSLSRLLVSSLGDVPLDSIKTLDVQRFVSTSSLSASRTRQAYRLLHQVMDMAVTYEVMDKNPCVRIRLPRMPKKEIVCLTVKDIDRLAEAADQHGGYGHFIRFMAYTGLRWGEAAALQHKHIDGNKVYVRRNQVDINGVLSYGSPKSHSERMVFLPASFTLPTGAPDEHVFKSPQGKALRSTNFARNVWHPATEAIGRPDLRVHDLRHTACSLLIQANVHPKVIQRLMGHSSITVTMDTYGHLIGNALEEASIALDGLLTA